MFEVPEENPKENLHSSQDNMNQNTKKEIGNWNSMLLYRFVPCGFKSVPKQVHTAPFYKQAHGEDIVSFLSVQLQKILCKNDTMTYCSRVNAPNFQSESGVKIKNQVCVSVENKASVGIWHITGGTCCILLSTDLTTSCVWKRLTDIAMRLILQYTLH